MPPTPLAIATSCRRSLATTHRRRPATSAFRLCRSIAVRRPTPFSLGSTKKTRFRAAWCTTFSMSRRTDSKSERGLSAGKTARWAPKRRCKGHYAGRTTITSQARARRARATASLVVCIGPQRGARVRSVRGSMARRICTTSAAAAWCGHPPSIRVTATWWGFRCRNLNNLPPPRARATACRCQPATAATSGMTDATSRTR